MNSNAFSYVFRVFLLLGLLYLFFVSIALMSASIKMFGKGFAEQLLATTSSPFVGLFIGILATSLVQSSSTTTSMTVALVASGAVDLQGAIPIIMGANVGTSVTNTLVALAHITRAGEFKKAFAAATMHDFFNLIAIIALFPLNYFTNVLEILAKLLSGLFQAAGGLKFANPLKMATAPAVDLVKHLVASSGWIMLIIAVIFLLISLRYIVLTLKTLVIGRVETFFNETLFKNAFRSFVIGLILTVMVQSSSITTSLAVPLASTGIFALRQIFPYTLGANVGTTITAILASMVTANPIAVATAFAHLMFNMLGIIMIWPVKELPIWLAERLADLAIKNRLIPIVYIVCVFFIIPATFIFFMR